MVDAHEGLFGLFVLFISQGPQSVAVSPKLSGKYVVRDIDVISVRHARLVRQYHKPAYDLNLHVDNDNCKYSTIQHKQYTIIDCANIIRNTKLSSAPNSVGKTTSGLFFKS